MEPVACISIIDDLLSLPGQTNDEWFLSGLFADTGGHRPLDNGTALFYRPAGKNIGTRHTVQDVPLSLPF